MTSGFVAVDGGRLYFESEGSGPAVVLVHAGVANLRMWDPHVPALAADHTVIRYDTRGFGRTETEAVEFSNRADLVAVMDHVGADRACLVGVSRGGSIALDTTVEFPDRVDGLIVTAGGVGGFNPDGDAVSQSMWDDAERHWEAGDWEWLADFETRYWVDGPGQSEGRVDPAIRTLVHGWILDNYRAEKEEGTPRPLDPPAAGRLDGITCPTLVVIGALDDPGTNAACRFLASSITGAAFEVFDDAAHMLALEEPDRYVGTVRAFLEGLDRR